MKNLQFAVRSSQFAVLIFLVLQITQFKSFAQCSNCLVSDLHIETGINHEVSNNTFYNQGDGDQYWTLISAPQPFYNVPMCAIAQGQWNTHFGNGMSGVPTFEWTN